MELLNEIQQMMGAKINVVEAYIKHICCVGRAEHLHDALSHERCLTDALLTFDHQQPLIPVDFIHDAPNEIEVHGLHSVKVSSD